MIETYEEYVKYYEELRSDPMPSREEWEKVREKHKQKENQRELVQREMLEAGWQLFSEMEDPKSDDFNFSSVFPVAVNVLRKFAEIDNESLVHGWDVLHVMATAYSVKGNSDISGVHPLSRAGWDLLVFAEIGHLLGKFEELDRIWGLTSDDYPAIDINPATIISRISEVSS